MDLFGILTGGVAGAASAVEAAGTATGSTPMQGAGAANGVHGYVLLPLPETGISFGHFTLELGHFYQTEGFPSPGEFGDTVHIRFQVTPNERGGYNLDIGTYDRHGPVSEVRQYPGIDADVVRQVLDRAFAATLRDDLTYGEMQSLADEKSSNATQRGLATEPQKEKPLAPSVQPKSDPVDAPNLPSAGPRANLAEPSSAPISAEPNDFEWNFGDIALGVGKAALFTAVGLGVGVVAGPIVGAGIAGGLLFANFMDRYGEAVQRGAGEGAGWRALTASAGDMLPISPIELGEANYGFDYVTGRPLSVSERNDRLGTSVGGFGFGAAADAWAKNPSLRRELGSQWDNFRKQMATGRPRGYVIIGAPGTRPIRNKELQLVRWKTGHDSKNLVYNQEANVLSYRSLKDALKGTGLDANHLLLGEWFKKGPKHLRQLYEYVPSAPLAGGLEHQGTWHSGWIDEMGIKQQGVNEWLGASGLFKKKGRYSQDDIENGIKLLESWYRANGPGEPWKSYADAVAKFRVEVFDKMKK
jgi:hypothetical protein